MFCNQSLSRLSFCGGRDHGADAPIGGDKLRLGISRRRGVFRLIEFEPVFAAKFAGEHCVENVVRIVDVDHNAVERE
jgi:hypothetical protein